MSESQALEALLADLEFELEDDNVCGLYQFSWILSDFRGSLTDEQITRVCHQAYDEITRRHPMRLVWVDWPIDPSTAREVAPGTPLDFGVGSDGEVSSPLQALIRLD